MHRFDQAAELLGKNSGSNVASTIFFAVIHAGTTSEKYVRFPVRLQLLVVEVIRTRTRLGEYLIKSDHTAQVRRLGL